MDNQITSENVGSHHNRRSESQVLDIYPLSCYYFGSKEATPLKNETLYDRVLRMKAKYVDFYLYSEGFSGFFLYILT